MKRTLLPLTGLFALLFAVVILGCSDASDDSGTTSAESSATQSNEQTHSDHDHGSMADMDKGLAELSEADKALAMKQQVCPVSGEMLGTMGKPIKVTVKDHDVWVCCDGCTKQLQGDPDKYLAKLPGHGSAEDHSDHKTHADHNDGA